MGVIRRHRQEAKAEPTRRIKKYNVLSSVDAAFLRERCSYLLRSLVKLHAGGCAHCYTLKDGNNAKITLIFSIIVKVYLLYFSAY